jgi:hypothetical protein
VKCFLNISTGFLYGSTILSNPDFLMGKPKKFKDAVRLSVVLSKLQAERVRYMSLRMSTKEGRAIGVSEAIRMAIEAAYPVPKNQKDMFE